MKKISIVTEEGNELVEPQNVLGQLAIHPTPTLREGKRELYGNTVTHVMSGRRVFEFRPEIPVEEVERLADMLRAVDFDAYFRDGCTDKMIPLHARAIREVWWQDVAVQL